MTIWDLLNHRSGFVDEWATLLMMHSAMSNRFEKEQFLRLLYTQPEPEIEPGDLLLLKDEKMLSSFLFSTGSVLEIIPELFFTDCCANEMIVNITEKR